MRLQVGNKALVVQTWRSQLPRCLTGAGASIPGRAWGNVKPGDHHDDHWTFYANLFRRVFMVVIWWRVAEDE